MTTMMTGAPTTGATALSRQYCTFSVSDLFFGIAVEELFDPTDQGSPS